MFSLDHLVLETGLSPLEASMATAFMPAGMRSMAGPVMAMAMAKKYSELGISLMFANGDDYPWVCPCTPFADYPANADWNATGTKKRCPYEKKMGCMDSLR